MESNQVLLRLTSQETPMLISYNRISGKDIITMETGSGGVIKDDRINITTIECRL